jgi:hypothetical protein
MILASIEVDMRRQFCFSPQFKLSSSRTKLSPLEVWLSPTA